MPESNFNLYRVTTAVVLVSLFSVNGCGGKKEADKTSSQATAVPKANRVADKNVKPVKPVAEAKIESRSVKRDLIGDAPAVAMRNMFNGLASGQPVALWNALPANYQKDLNVLAKSTISLIDPQVRSRFFVVFNRAATVMKNKKQLILPALRGRSEASDTNSGLSRLIANYDNIVSLADALTKSELTNPSWQEDPDLGSFLAGSGASIVRYGLALINKNNPLTKLMEFKGAKVTMGPPEGTNQVVIIASHRTISTNTVMLVEGKWLPRVALAYRPEINNLTAKAELAVPNINENTKQTHLKQLASIDDILSSIEQAQDVKGAREAIDNLMRMTGQVSSNDVRAVGRRSEWNYGAGERITRIDAFVRWPKKAVQQVFGKPDSQLPSANTKQVEGYWLYRNMRINDRSKNSNTQATKVFFGFKDGMVVRVLVAP